MKTFVIILLALVAATGSIYAQNLIAVQNGGEPTFYQQVDSAIIYAQNGDTILIPGGTWDITKPINKRLHLVGAGHNPDATSATFATTLQGNITLDAGASNGSITGIYLRGRIHGSNNPVNYFTTSRCHIVEGIYADSQLSNLMFIENIIDGDIGSGGIGSATNCSFINNIISAYFGNGENWGFIKSTYKNNIFTKSTYSWGFGVSVAVSGQYLLLENNVFLGLGSTLNAVFNSTAKNNLFVESNPFPNGTTNVGSNNITGQEQSTIFVNQEGATFNYAHDYHLQTNSPAKNAGTDGTDVGIYGGIYPWKEGSIPFNPHFETIQISPKTDDNGNLNVNIKVAAQER